MMNQRVIDGLVKAEFYVYCTSHGNRRCTFFCLTCEGPVFCDNCNHHATYPNHLVIRVYKASRETVLDREDIGRLGIVDISNVQKYKVNGRSIAFLKQKSNKASTECTKCRTCRTCGCRLEAETVSSDYIYCSIECKMRGTKGIDQNPHGNEEERLLEPTGRKKKCSKSTARAYKYSNDDHKSVCFKLMDDVNEDLLSNLEMKKKHRRKQSTPCRASMV